MGDSGKRVFLRELSDHPQFWLNHPFSFENLGEQRSPILQPSDIVLPESDIIPTYHEQPGERPPHFDFDRFEMRRNLTLAGESSHFRFPVKFCTNSDDTITDQIPREAQINKPIHLTDYESKAQSITAITIQTALSPSLFPKFELYKNVEILSLREAGISSLPHTTFPRLRVADFVDNKISNPSELASFCREHANTLAIIDFRRNPVSRSEKIRHEVILEAFNLRYLNGRYITVRDRYQAMIVTKIPDADRFHFFHQVKAIPELLSLPQWDCSMLMHLSLPNCGVTAFYVGDFENLITLNLSGNQITHISNSGLVALKNLHSLDLSHNKLYEFAEFDLALPFLDSLQHIWLYHNPMSNYRARLLNATRNLPGTIFRPGLATIDDLPVSIDEIIHASAYSSDLNPQYILDYRWYRCVRSCIGQLKPSAVLSLSLVGRSLHQVFLSQYRSLTHLTLRNNYLTELKGLNHCKSLVFLDVSGNPDLDLNATLEELKGLPKLRYLLLAVDCWDLNSTDNLFVSDPRPRSVHNEDYRRLILETLVVSNYSLTYLDRIQISVPERVSLLNVNKVHLAFLQSAVSPRDIDFDPERIAPGVQYQPELITELIGLHHSTLENEPTLNFSIFPNIQKIDLNGNNLASILNLGLENCPYLKYLNVANNQIADSEIEIAHLIDSLPALSMMSIRGNPLKRGEIISSIKRLNKAEDSFHVLDYEINPQEFPDQSTKFLKAVNIRFTGDLTVLSLAGCGFTEIDLSQFYQLVKLNLANNQFSTMASIKGIEYLNKCQLLNLSKNCFCDLNEIVNIIDALPRLTNIGIYENGLSPNYRTELISRLPNLLNTKYPLLFIDDEIITRNEITTSQKLSNEMISRFSFELALARSETDGITLDLNKQCLDEYLDFSQFPEITYLDLSDNEITNETFLNSKLEVCTKLQTLKLTNNQTLNNSRLIGQFLSSFRELKEIDFLGTGLEHLLEEISSLSEQNCKLVKVNNEFLSMDDRIRIVSQQQRSDTFGEEYRTSYLLKQMGPDWLTLTHIDLSNQNIGRISSLSVLGSNLQVLNLSNNRIRTIERAGFDKFINLRSLDIRNNRIDFLETIYTSLCDCPRLEKLMMLGSTGSSETQTVSSYSGTVCSVLRGLVEIDTFLNPLSLKGNQLNAIKDLEQITGWNNPNHLHSIDLSNRNIPIRDFTTVLVSLGILGPRFVNLAGNPCSTIDKYRYLIIYHVPDVQEIDGSKVTVDERMNADNAIRVAVSITAIDTVIVEGAAAACEYLDHDQRDDLRDTITTAGQYAIEYGTAITKWEIFITFQQITMQVVNFFKKEIWPAIYIAFSWVSWIFTIDLSFLNYLLDVRLPFWFSYSSFFLYIVVPVLLFSLYHVQPDRPYWYNLLTKDWCRTFCLSLLALLMMVICSVGLGFLADINVTINQGKLTNNQRAWMTILSIISLVLMLLFWIFAAIFRRQHQNPVFWYKVLKFKKRFALFILTVLYFPICKSFVNTFKCSNGHSDRFDEVACFKDAASFQMVHLAALVFGVTYAIGIPWFFVWLINKGVREIDRNYRIQTKLRQLDEQEAQAKKLSWKESKEMKKELKLQRKRIEKEYQLAAVEYENAASYLYNGYKRNDRYKKVFSMIEKLAYLLITALVPWQVIQTVTNSVVMVGMTLAQLASNPFSATNENWMEGFSKCGNCLTMAVGSVLNFSDKTAEQFKQIWAPTILIGVAVIGIALFIWFLTQDSGFCEPKDPADEEEEEEDMADEDSDESEESARVIDTMKTLMIGTLKAAPKQLIEVNPDDEYGVPMYDMFASESDPSDFVPVDLSL